MKRLCGDFVGWRAFARDQCPQTGTDTYHFHHAVTALQQALRASWNAGAALPILALVHAQFAAQA